MTFAWPFLLWWLLMPAALLVWEFTRRRAVAANTHPKILQAEASARSLQVTAFAASPQTTTRRHPPRVWLCVGLALAIIALARPQWGRIEEPVFDQSREILLAIDLSRSMLAEDVRPSRLDRAKLLVQSLLEKLAGERVGLVVYSGTAFLQCPLSADYEILREFLPALNPDFLPSGGTNYRALLDCATDAFSRSGAADRFLIVLSDGEATDESWRERVATLKERNIRVLALGVGTTGGAMIPDGSGGLVKDERGAVVLSRLEPGTLQELARDTQGAYRDASGWIDLAALVKQTIDAARQGQFVEKNTVRHVERFQWPLALALWCLLVSFCYEIPVRPRVRAIGLARGAREQGAGSKEQAKGTAVAAALVLFLLPAPCSLLRAADAPSPTPEPPALAKIVGRLAASPARTARDWSEFAGETVSWGQGLQGAQQRVPEGPVRDALAAVSLGAKLDARAADWPKLRADLEALLQKPEDEQKQQQQQQQQPNQDQKQKDEQQKQEQQPSKQDRKSQDQKSQNQPQDRKNNGEQDPSSTQPEKKEEPPPQPGESAFGDMKEKSPPPPPQPADTQKVGGAPQQENQSPEAKDPALAVPLQKLDQLRNQNSPAQLFQLMEGERKQPKKSGKDW